MIELRVSGFWYLATPYRRYPEGLEAAFVQAAKMSAWLTRNGVRVFCPILHGHPMSAHAGLDPVDHEFWLGINRPFMEAAHGLAVARMESWEASLGIAEEAETFTKMDKPIVYLDWPHESP